MVQPQAEAARRVPSQSCFCPIHHTRSLNHRPPCAPLQAEMAEEAGNGEGSPGQAEMAEEAGNGEGSPGVHTDAPGTDNKVGVWVGVFVCVCVCLCVFVCVWGGAGLRAGRVRWGCSEPRTRCE